MLQDWEFLLRVLSRHDVDLLDAPPLARWHQRPHSTGDAANSVADARHARVAAEMLDRDVRDAVARHGWGPSRQVAAESQRLGELIDEGHRHLHFAVDTVHQHLDLLSRAIDDLTAQQRRLEETATAQASRLARLEAAVKYFSMGATIRRFTGRLRPRRRR